MSLGNEARWSIFYQSASILQPDGDILPIQINASLTAKILRILVRSDTARQSWYTAGFLSHRLTPGSINPDDIPIQVQSDRIPLGVKQIIFLENVEAQAFLVFSPVAWLTQLKLTIEKYE